jgi:hypothetical protein
MTDHGIVVRYEVRWTWEGERQSLQFGDLETAVQCAITESRDWTADGVRGSHLAVHRRAYKRSTVHAISPSRRRRLIGTYENGKLVSDGEWS